MRCSVTRFCCPGCCETCSATPSTTRLAAVRCASHAAATARSCGSRYATLGSAYAPTRCRRSSRHFREAMRAAWTASASGSSSSNTRPICLATACKFARPKGSAQRSPSSRMRSRTLPAPFSVGLSDETLHVVAPLDDLHAQHRHLCHRGVNLPRVVAAIGPDQFEPGEAPSYLVEHQPVGYDAGKKVKGRKIHALVDTEGLPMRVIVHSAAIQDRDAATRPKSPPRFPRAG